MPSQNMLPKGKRRQSVKKEYREQRGAMQEREAAARAAGEDVPGGMEWEMVDTSQFAVHVSPYAGRPGLVTDGPMGGKHPQEEHTQPRYRGPKKFVEPAAEIHVVEDLDEQGGVRSFAAEESASGVRLDAYLAKALADVSRARVQLLIEKGQVTVDGELGKGKNKLKGGELIEIDGVPQPEPLHATAEDIPLDVIYEDEDLAVVNKAAGMMVHAGTGGEEHNRGTLVNALLFHFGKSLSQVGGELRPGIVHRLDKATSGLIVVAKNDVTHRKLGDMFSERRLRKVYLALVHGAVKDEEGTITLPIARDVLRRTRMTTRRSGGRTAVTHWKVLERIDGAFGKFTLLEVRIETGRTHQIRVHMQSLGHAVVGDTLYGAPRRVASKIDAEDAVEMDRNFLHAAQLEFTHPRSGKALALDAALPEELVEVLERVRG